MSRDEIDPEDLADLRLRASSERDSTRTRGDGTYEWSPAALVEEWPCRNCGTALVGVTAEQVSARAMFNTMLRRQNERVIDTDEVVFCPPCLDLARASGVERRRRAINETELLIRQLKTLSDENDPRERSILARLRDLGHPDVEGLRKAIADGRAAKTTTTKRRTI